MTDKSDKVCRRCRTPEDCRDMLVWNRLCNLRRRVDRARNFPVNTCGASRHLHMIADALAGGHKYHEIDEFPEHVACSIYAVLERLWKLRTQAEHPSRRQGEG